MAETRFSQYRWIHGEREIVGEGRKEDDGINSRARDDGGEAIIINITVF